jgi:hypothetical protein
MGQGDIRMITYTKQNEIRYVTNDTAQAGQEVNITFTDPALEGYELIVINNKEDKLILPVQDNTVIIPKEAVVGDYLYCTLINGDTVKQCNAIKIKEV